MLPTDEPGDDSRHEATKLLAALRHPDGAPFTPRREAVRQIAVALDAGVPIDWITVYIRIARHRASTDVGAILRACADMPRLTEGWLETQRA